MQIGNQQNMQQSDGDEVFDQLKNNADQYAIPDKDNQQGKNDQMINYDINIPDNRPIDTNKQEQIIKGNKPMTFEQIKLVSSTQVSGDGHNKSVRVICPHCNSKVDTVIRRVPGKETYIASCILLLCSFGIVCIACLPCFIDDCRDVYHTCPECKGKLGRTKFHILD